MMYDAIQKFPLQFAYRPAIVNKNKLRTYRRFVVLGMGGSNLAPDLFKIREPRLNVISHRDYGLPTIEPSLQRDTLFIASSYSGNTEETLAGFDEARRRGLSLAVLTTGGKLLERAKRFGVPYVELPKTGIQPRSALGFALLGLAALMKQPKLEHELRALQGSLKTSPLEKKGKILAKALKGRVPVIYASLQDFSIAYNWKIKFNETGKIPAFANSFPELNHNEMTGFDAVPSTKKLSKDFHFVFLKNGFGNKKIAKRMDVTAKLYRARGLKVEIIPISGAPVFERICNSLMLADFTAYYTAELYKVEAEQVPMVEEFKKLIQNPSQK
jgi:glucose/mannose-6-phosphate isomerase